MSVIDRAIGISSYFLAFLWGIFLLFSLIGWGTLVNRLLFPKYRVDWGQRSAWGIAFSIAVGGLLNLTWTISPIIILVYLCLGLFACIIDTYQNKHSFIHPFTYLRNYRREPLFILSVLGVLLLLLIQYAGWTYTHRFHGFDDYPAYMVFAKKMLQMGSLGADPFSERKITSSLGGQYFLQTFILTSLKPVNLNLIDPGLALIISVGILCNYLKEKNISKEIAVFLLFVFLIIPYPKTNLSSMVIPIPLFLSYFVFLDSSKLKFARFLSNACLIALITAAICSLKSTLIPACVLLFISSYIFYIFQAQNYRKEAIYEFLVASILTISFLLPWAIAMYQSSGTLLYPLLGRGYHGSVYGTYLLPSNELNFSKAITILFYTVTRFDFIALILLGVASFVSLPKNISDRGVIPSAFISSGLGIILILLAIGNHEDVRVVYPFPFVYPALIFLLINCTQLENIDNQKRVSALKSLLIAMLVAGILLGGSDALGYSNYKRFSNFVGNIRVGLSDMPLFSEQEVDRYAKMQQAIPESETVLTRLENPFLMNFKRNLIFITDMPGGASLPPGMPSFKGGETLADYLTSKSIRYVAYSYASEANFPKRKQLWLLKSHIHPWDRTVGKHTLDFQDNLKELGNTRKRIYDDGDIFVLDLLSDRI
jgi:hypothetical protein